MMGRSMAMGCAVAALAFVVVGAARADPAIPSGSPPVAASDSKLALARQLIVATDAAGAIRRMASSMSAGMAHGLGTISKAGDLDTFLPKLLNEELDQLGKELVPQLAQIYADTFDEAELRDLLAFYNSPAGRKLIEKQPELSRRGQALTAPMIPRIQADMIVKTLNHVCVIQKCNADQLKAMETVKQQLLERIKVQALAGAKEAV